VALWSVAIVVVVAVKVAVVAAAATVTEAGTVSAGLLLESATEAPPAGAALVRVTVQVEDEFWLRLVGLHVTEETSTGATRLIVAVAEVVPRVAVRVALWSLETVVVEAVNEAVVAPEATATEAGAESVALVLVSVTETPPLGAALDRVTVHVLEAFGPMLLGVQDRAETAVTPTRATFVVAEAFKVAVMVAL
jgi:hypothetical protein